MALGVYMLGREMGIRGYVLVVKGFVFVLAQPVFSRSCIGFFVYSSEMEGLGTFFVRLSWLWRV